MTVYAADWVLPVDAPPIASGAVVVEDGLVAAVGTGDGARRGRPRFDESAIVPGFVNAHSHLEYAVYAGFGDGLDFGPWLMVHVERKRPLDWDDAARDRAARRGRVPRVGDHDDGRRELLGRGRASVRRARAARDRRTSRSSGRRRTRCVAQFERDRASASRTRSATACGSASRRTRRTRSPPSSTRPVRGARPAGRDAPRRERGRGRVAARRHRAVGRVARPPRRAARTTAIRDARRATGSSARRCSPRTASRSTRRRSRCSRAHDVAVAHCPRSNAMLGCGVAPVARAASPPASASGSAPTARPRRRRSTCSTRCGRPSASARARERRRTPSRRRSAGARHARLGTRARARRRGRVAGAGQAGRPHRRLARRVAVLPVGGSSRGGRLRRLARARTARPSSTARCGTGREGTEWHELTAAAQRARPHARRASGNRAVDPA